MPPSTGLPKIQKNATLEEMAYQQIKQGIINGIFAPGEFMAEVRLAETLGISKTPVRKAMSRLQQEQFLTNIPFAGYHVAEISIADILEVYELREILECFLVKETVGHFSPAEITSMRKTLDQAGTALSQNDYTNFVEFNRQFHHSFDRKYANQRISSVLTNLDEHVHRILIYLFPDEQRELSISHQEHFQILNAIITEDADAAVAHMHNHLARFRDVLVALRQKRGQLKIQPPLQPILQPEP